MGGERLILTILALAPILVGLVLMALPHLLPESSASQVRKVSRNICMGVALALLAISTWAAASSPVSYTHLRAHETV